MQREIKFRGYDLELKQWHYGNYYFYTDTIYCVASDKDHEENEHHCILFDGFCDWNMPRPHYKAIVDGKTIGQYTGLKDKNGKEIYEGDIVSCYYACGLPFNAVVEFRDGCFDIKSEHNRDYLKVLVANRAIEVIGNIYSNPELLKEDTHE